MPAPGVPQRSEPLLCRLERIELPGGQPGPGWAWWCPGCLAHHAVDARWMVTDPETRTPTVVPSLVVLGNVHGRPRCHSMIRAGHIEFFSDCDHPWAGNTLPLESFEAGGQEGTAADQEGGF